MVIGANSHGDRGVIGVSLESRAMASQTGSRISACISHYAARVETTDAWPCNLDEH
jgi:hypothetical protein